ncbi:MAG: DUF58 domain-containing protein [Planctomycetia bacterium]|nr:DUF58 domain-containing protein [Planctomycetia bacterium]
MRWYLAAVLLLLAALVFRLGLLAYAMYALLALLISSRLLARRWVEGLTATRECNRLAAEIGEKVAVVVNVTNTGRLPVPWVLLEDLLPRAALVQRPPRLRITGKRLAISMLAPHGRKTMFYQLNFEMRGYYQIGPVVLESGDLFGLHRRYRVATEPHFVLVYPKVIPLAGFDLASRRPIGEVRMTHRLYEDPTRIAGVRLYQAGDPLNRVHWKATARTTVLHSKIYEPSCIAGATVLLDFHKASYAPRHEPVRSELAVTTAASLSNAVYQLGQQIGFVTNGRDAVDRIRQEGWDQEFRTRASARGSASMSDTSDRLAPVIVPTRRGPEQLRRILETLARVELTDGLAFSQLITEVTGRLPADATVIAVLADVPPETAWALGNLRRRGLAVTAVLVSFDEFESHDLLGRLIAEGLDVRHVTSEASLAALCQRQLVRW